MFQHQRMYLPEVNRPPADIHGQQYLFSSHPLHFSPPATRWLPFGSYHHVPIPWQRSFVHLQIWKNFNSNFGSCLACVPLVNPSNISLLLLSALTSEKPDWETNQQLEDSCIWAVGCAQHGLLQVEFRYWGMQAKIEQFIHNMALRNTMLRAHRWVFIRFAFQRIIWGLKCCRQTSLGVARRVVRVDYGRYQSYRWLSSSTSPT